MRMLQGFVLSVLLLAAVPLRASPPGATVQWHYDSQDTVTVSVTNVSGKDITGYNLSIKETYAGGRVLTHELMSDFLLTKLKLDEVAGTPSENSLRKAVGDGWLRPGSTRERVVHVEPGLADYQVTIDAIAYADDTAEATNDAALGRIRDHRKALLASTEKVIAAVAQANSNPNAAADQLQSHPSVYDPSTFDAGVVYEAVQRLQAVARHPEGDALGQYLATMEKRKMALAGHSHLVKTGGAQ